MIYFIHNPTRDLIKIGTSHNVARRLEQIQSESCDELRLIGEWIGDQAEERLWHQRYQAYRTHGEWFLANDLLLADLHYHEFFCTYDLFRPISQSRTTGPDPAWWACYLIALHRAHRAGNDTLHRAVVQLDVVGVDLAVRWAIPPSYRERHHFESAWSTEFGQPGASVWHDWYLRGADGGFFLTSDGEHPTGIKLPPHVIHCPPTLTPWTAGR